MTLPPVTTDWARDELWLEMSSQISSLGNVGLGPAVPLGHHLVAPLPWGPRTTCGERDAGGVQRETER